MNTKRVSLTVTNHKYLITQLKKKKKYFQKKYLIIVVVTM